MRGSISEMLPRQAPGEGASGAEAPPGGRIARLAEARAGGRLWVRFAGAAATSEARTTLDLPEATWRKAAAEGREVLVVAAQAGQGEVPVIVGLLQPVQPVQSVAPTDAPPPGSAAQVVAPQVDARQPAAWHVNEVGEASNHQHEAQARAPGALEGEAAEIRSNPLEARVDGRRVVLEGAEEVTLRCGKASVVLRSDGKLLLRGAYVESYSSGIQRIKGGVVKIN